MHITLLITLYMLSMIFSSSVNYRLLCRHVLNHLMFAFRAQPYTFKMYGILYAKSILFQGIQECMLPCRPSCSFPVYQVDQGVSFLSQVNTDHEASGKKQLIVQSSKQNLIFGKLWLFVCGFIDIGFILLISSENSIGNERKMKKQSL